MKKIIVLTGHFPPDNSAGASRPYSWVKYLSNFGYYPVIFCLTTAEKHSYTIDQKGTFEVHRLNREEAYFLKQRRLINNSFLARMLGATHYALENSLSYSGSVFYLNQLLNYVKTNEVHCVIATAPPYFFFGIAHQLSLKTQLPWIADYRDDWSTSELFSNYFFRIVGKIDSIRERKYLRSAKFFTSTTQHYIHKIGKFTGKDGVLIENGFFPEDIPVQQPEITYGKLKILYPGTLYSTQKIDIVIAALSLLPVEITDEIEISFLGVDRVPSNIKETAAKYIGQCLFFHRRVSRMDSFKIFLNTDLFLLITHRDKSDVPIKGIFPSKLYDMIGFRKPVLVCPSDHDIIEKKLTSTGQGVFCNNSSRLASSIIAYHTVKKQKGFVPQIDIPEDVYWANTRKCQAENLAKAIDSNLPTNVSIYQSPDA